MINNPGLDNTSRSISEAMEPTTDRGADTLFVRFLSGPSDFDSPSRPDPTWEEIEQAIRQVGTPNGSLVTLGQGADGDLPYFCVGSDQGLYVAYLTYDNLHFFNLTNSSGDPAKIVLLVIGGQEGDYCEAQCVDLDTVLQAARTFAHTGVIDATCNWQQS